MTLPRSMHCTTLSGALLAVLLLLLPATPVQAQGLVIRVAMDGWEGEWTQRGLLPVWDAVWTKGGERVTASLAGSVRNGRIDLRRTASSDGVLCSYSGRVEADGHSITGTQDCPGHGATAFSGSLWGPGFGRGGPKPAPASGMRYRVENLVYGQAEGATPSRGPREFIVDFARCTVHDANENTAQGWLAVDKVLCQAQRRLNFRTQATDGPAIEYDWLLLEGGQAVSGAWRQGAAFGASLVNRVGGEPGWRQR
ncbi:MAG: hypothetical protein HY855_27000 [Burkholderiales bacterium]|nr:hypothetical protein [Burkholderiales bacterium]